MPCMHHGTGESPETNINNAITIMFKRILLKLSGESLAGESKQGIDTERLNQYAAQVKAIAQKVVQIGIVIGG